MFSYSFKWLCSIIFIFVVFLLANCGLQVDCQEASKSCLHGTRTNSTGMCVCSPGWTGSLCDYCIGRVSLNATEGVITDGPNNYRKFQDCSWVVDVGQPHTTVWLQLEHFVTECIWDAVYIFDGDSVDAPLLGSFSGYITPQSSDVMGSHSFVKASDGRFIRPGSQLVNSSGNYSGLPYRSPVELRATSGLLYVYFFSDAAYEASGFNLTYSVASCPGQPDCASNGICDSTTYRCQCFEDFTGADCSVQLCDDTLCAENGGTCTNQTLCTSCPTGRHGVNCEQFDAAARWDYIDASPLSTLASQWQHQGRSSHTMVEYMSTFYIFGGYAANRPEYYPFESLLAFKPASSMWSAPAVNLTDAIPANRYGHTAVVYQGVMYVFGGRLTPESLPVNELWSLDLSQSLKRWVQLTPSGDMPLPVALHSATIVNGIMIVIWGVSVTDAEAIAVQEYDIAANHWNASLPKSTVYLHPRAGHTAVYSSSANRILVFGGVTQGKRSGALMSYDPVSRHWLASLNSLNAHVTFLHSAVLGPSPTNGDYLVIAGGCRYADSTSLRGTQCQSNEFILLDLRCLRWRPFNIPDFHGFSLARFGHTAISINGSMWIFGGYDGTYRNDMIRFHFAQCSAFANRTSCLSSLGAGCLWQPVDGVCKDANVAYDTTYQYERWTCRPNDCPLLASCPVCNSHDNCSFGATGCSPGVMPSAMSNAAAQPCNMTATSTDLSRLACSNCKQVPGWTFYESKCRPITAVPPNKTADICTTDLCNTLTTCTSCTMSAGSCFWCPSLRVCVNTAVFVSRYPYSECLRWVDKNFPGGVCPADRCSSFRNCSTCLSAPGCGWCDDGSNSGRGTCRAGNTTGPLPASHSGWLGSALAPNSTLTGLDECPASLWNYLSCHGCQCNGRAMCDSNGLCVNCSGNTTGAHCQHCRPGLYGNIHLENGTCQPCQCNGHGTLCNNVKGSCTCADYGTTGNQCESCQGQFLGNSTNSGLCFRRVYPTLTEANFNKLPVGPFPDRRAQFVCSPHFDRRIVLTFRCNVSVKFNMTIEYSNANLVGIQYALTHKQSTKSLKFTFSQHDYNFDGIDKIRIYLSDLPKDEPVLVEIQYLYQDAIDLLIVFATFFGCFLSLLLLALIFWYIRQYFRTWRMRRTRQQELISMAQRPFSTVKMINRGRHPSQASPLVVQPLSSADKVALCSFAVRLPSPGSGSGLMVGSTLLSVKKQKLFHNRTRHQGGATTSRQRAGSRQFLIDEDV